VPCGIFLICLLEGLERGSVFSLCAACLYLFSGSAPGNYVIVFITALGVAVTAFRQNFLQKGFPAALICTAAAMFLYEMAVFALGLFLSMTTLSRIGSRCVTTVLTLATVPVLYPVLSAISTIGGEAWKE
jgi:hypothetical protein